MGERLPPRNVVNKECTRCTTIIRTCDRAERFLTRRVPDLELDLLLVNGDHPSAELNTNREVVNGLEATVGELEKKA